ncbi:hypothetical protein GCM10027175_07670 [Hymenobacter latericoloratus]
MHIQTPPASGRTGLSRPRTEFKSAEATESYSYSEFELRCPGYAACLRQNHSNTNADGHFLVTLAYRQRTENDAGAAGGESPRISRLRPHPRQELFQESK